MDVVLSNNTFPGKTSGVSETKSETREVKRDSTRSSSETPSKAETSAFAVSVPVNDSVELASQTKSVNENGNSREKPEEDQEKASAGSKEKNILFNETLLQYRIEENEDEKTGEKSKELVIYLKDKKTGEVIRQIPPKDFNDQSNNKLPSSGIFIDQEG